MVRLTHLGQRFLFTVDPFATPIAYEKVFQYLVVGVGEPSLDPSKYALSNPVGASSGECVEVSECASMGHAFRVSDGVLYCDITIVRTWSNPLPLPIVVREIGFSPNPAGTPLSAVGYIGDSEPVARVLHPGDRIAVKLSISLAIGPMTLTTVPLYLGGGREYPILFGIFASSPSWYPTLLRMFSGSVSVNYAWGTPTEGYRSDYIQLAGCWSPSNHASHRLYSHPYLFLSHDYYYRGTLETGGAFLIYPSTAKSGCYFYAGLYFSLPDGEPVTSLDLNPTLNVWIQ